MMPRGAIRRSIGRPIADDAAAVEGAIREFTNRSRTRIETASETAVAPLESAATSRCDEDRMAGHAGRQFLWFDDRTLLPVPAGIAPLSRGSRFRESGPMAVNR